MFRPLAIRPVSQSLLLIPFLAACAANPEAVRPAIPKGPEVVAIRVEGNHAFTDAAIISVIHAEATPPLLFWRKRHLDSGELEADQRRVANFYRLHGYFDVTVAPIRVVPYRRSLLSRKAPPAPPRRRPLDDPVPGPDLETLLSAWPGPGQADVENAHAADLGGDTGDKTGTGPSPTPSSNEREAPGPTAVPADRGDEPAAPGGVQTGPHAAMTGETAIDEPLRPTPTPREGPDRVALIIQVDEGTRYRVAEVRLDLRTRSRQPPRRPRRVLPPASDRIRRLVTSSIRLREGDAFDMAAQHADEAAIQAVLRQASYAWATVSCETILLPKTNEIRLRYHVTTGPPCFFGKVHIEGLQHVDPKIVRLRVRRYLAAGSPFRQDTLTALQNALYDLQLFQSVTVLPDESSRDRPVVEVVVSVREKTFREIRVGGGVKQETNWQEINAHTSWSNRYFSHRLIRLSLNALAGWGFSPGFQSSQAYAQAACTETGCSTEGRNGPILDVGAEASVPDFKGRRVTAGVVARFRVGQTLSYGYMSPKLELNTSRQMTPHLAVSFATGIEQYLPTPDALSQSAFVTGNIDDTGTVRFEGRLTYFQQRISFDRRDHVFAPERGLYLALVTQEAGLLGDFSFVKAVPDARVYLPIIPGRLIVGARYSTGVIVPIAGKSAPPVLYFQLGGGTTVRGIPWNGLTYYTGNGCVSPVPTPDIDTSCQVATGGTVFHLANLEFRVPLGEIGLVLFGDAGRVDLVSDNVLRTWLSPGLDAFLVSVGLGARYKTPVGPIRLDFGYRLREPVALAPGLAIVGDGCHCGIHLAIGEAF